MTQFQYLDGGNTEAQDKLAEAYLFEQASEGIAKTGVISGLGVAQTTTATANVTVGAGAGIVQTSRLNGADRLINDTDYALDVLTANPVGGLPRNDIVVLDQATLPNGVRVIVGTPNSVPTDPSVPATAVPLARLRHAASATTVPASVIDDLRTFVSLASSNAGWQTLSLAGGVAGTLKYRRRGKTVDIAIDVTGTFAGGSFPAVSAAGAIPAAARPTITPPRGVAYVGSGTTLGTVEVGTDGTVRVQNANAFSLAKANFSYAAG